MGSAETAAAPGLPGRVNASIEHGVAWLELDNPAKLNATSVAMWHQLIDALEGYETDPEVRCVVLTGKGGKAFCVGADIGEKDIEGTSAAQSEEMALKGLGRLRSFPKPTIAVINGYCLGAGLALATACDLRIAGRSARFGIPAARLGLAVYYDVLERLARLIGPSKAKLVLFTADRIDAEEALQWGLVDRLALDEETESTATELASRIVGNAPLTIGAAKWAVDMIFADPAARDMEAYLESERACYNSEDYVEGRLAFAEKRKPDFKGR